MDRELTCAWTAWLSERHWDSFLTVTFREPLPPHRVEGVLHAVGRTLLRHKPTNLFLGAEQHLSRMMHFHGLYRDGLIHIEPSDLWQDLFDTYGRSRVEKVRSVADVAAYCTKYVTKKLAYYQVW